MKEKDLQTQCENYLSYIKIEFLHLPTVICKYIGGRLITIPIPQKKGFPDLEIYMKYKSFFVELKVGKNKLTKDQIRWQRILLSLGYEYYIVKSFRRFRQVVDFELQKREQEGEI